MRCFVLNFVILECMLGFVQCVSFEEDSRLTASEKDALDKLKAIVIPQIPETSYVKNYINDDLYFVRWLRARNNDVRGAERMFLDHLAWREKEGMDGIIDEDFGEIANDFPIYLGAVDKKGRPLAEFWFTEWPIRTAALAGKTKQVIRWTARMFEFQQRQLFKARAAGRKVTQAVCIIETGSFSLVQQGCPLCLPVALSITQTYENNYPNIWESYYLVNMAPSFELVLRFVAPIQSKPSRDAMKIQPRKEEWLKLFDEKIDKNQRSVRYGGTINRE